MNTTIRRRILLASLVLATGCATHGEGWLERATHVPLPARFVEVDSGELPRVCGNYPGKLLHGCAQRDYLNGVCWIYTAPRPPLWLQMHESYHCAGYDHG